MNGYALLRLTRRNLAIFLKDKANVFFSLLSPLIVLALYILFLGKLQEDGLIAELQANGITVSGGGLSAISAFCDSWMLAGAMSCACITVPLCACGIMVQDKTRGITADLAVSPVSKWVAPAAYFCSVVAAGLVIGAVVLAVCFLYLAISGMWTLSAAAVFGCIGALVVSVIASSTMLVFLVGFFRSQGAFTALNIIFGTVIGFLIGAYIPITSFPKAIQTITLFLPGSYTAGLFRNYMMGGALGRIGEELSAEFASVLEERFSLSFRLFGAEVGIPAMFLVLVGSAVLFAALNVLVATLRDRGKKSFRHHEK